MKTTIFEVGGVGLSWEQGRSQPFSSPLVDAVCTAPRLLRTPNRHLPEEAHLDHDAYWPSSAITRRQYGDHPLRSASIGRLYQH